MQNLQGQFMLRTKLIAVVDSVITVSGAVEHDLTSAEALASYESIHPLYLQAKPPRDAVLQNVHALLAWQRLALTECPVEEAKVLRGWLVVGQGDSASYSFAHHRPPLSSFIWLVGRTCEDVASPLSPGLKAYTRAGQGAGLLRHGGHAWRPVGVHVLRRLSGSCAPDCDLRVHRQAGQPAAAQVRSTLL